MDQSITPIVVVSGFLGAGKTTLINKFLQSALSPSETILIENEFGEVSIDDELLSPSGIRMKTLASGCICCTLSSNFIIEIPKIVEKYHPQVILIEPTGMASPSDLLGICSQIAKAVPVRVTSLISVINAQNIERVLRLDIPAFNRQFECVSYIILTHIEDLSPDEIEMKKKLIRGKVGNEAVILATPLDQLDGLEILTQAEQAFAQSGLDAKTAACPTEPEPEHEHEREHSHSHDHDSLDDIVTKTFYPSQSFSIDQMQMLLAQIDAGDFGTVIRAKGFLKKNDAETVLVEQVLGSGSLAETQYKGPSKLVIIGRGLDEDGLSRALGA